MFGDTFSSLQFSLFVQHIAPSFLHSISTLSLITFSYLNPIPYTGVRSVLALPPNLPLLCMCWSTTDLLCKFMLNLELSCSLSLQVGVLVKLWREVKCVRVCVVTVLVIALRAMELLLLCQNNPCCLHEGVVECLKALGVISNHINTIKMPFCSTLIVSTVVFHLANLLAAANVVRVAILSRW